MSLATYCTICAFENNDDFDFSMYEEQNVNEVYNKDTREEALLKRLGEMKRNLLMGELF